MNTTVNKGTKTRKQVAIIEKALKGNISQRDFNDIYEAFHLSVYNILLECYTNRNQMDAEELTNDVFMKVYNNIHLYNNKLSQFHSWLYTITNRCGIDYTRKMAIELQKSSNKHLYLDDFKYENVNVIFEPAAPTSFASDILIKRKELSTKIERAFGAIKRPVARQIMEAYYSGIKGEKMAKMFGMTHENIRLIIHRTEKELQINLKGAL